MPSPSLSWTHLANDIDVGFIELCKRTRVLGRTTHHEAVGNYVSGDIVVEVIVGMGIGMAIGT
jgi:hypothetical protein